MIKFSLSSIMHIWSRVTLNIDKDIKLRPNSNPLWSFIILNLEYLSFWITAYTQSRIFRTKAEKIIVYFVTLYGVPKSLWIIFPGLALKCYLKELTGSKGSFIYLRCCIFYWFSKDSISIKIEKSIYYNNQQFYIENFIICYYIDSCFRKT
jgi:hypothetical protein